MGRYGRNARWDDQRDQDGVIGSQTYATGCSALLV